METKFIEKLKGIMIAYNMSQREIAKQIGCSQGTISVWLRGVPCSKKEWKDRVNEFYKNRFVKGKTKFAKLPKKVESEEDKYKDKIKTLEELVEFYKQENFRLKDAQQAIRAFESRHTCQLISSLLKLYANKKGVVKIKIDLLEKIFREMF